MRSLVPAILVFTVLAIATITFVSITDDGEEGMSNAETYQINYRLNGGQLPEGAGNVYVSGSYMPLPMPYREGYHFAGWCTESAMTNPIGGIVSTLKGHITLYAKWIEDDREGLGWNTSISGSYYNGDILHKVSGSASYGYGKSTGDSILLTERNSITYTWPDGSTTNSSESSEWITNLVDGWRYTGNVMTNGSRATIWQLGNSTMWVKDLLIPLKVETKVDKGTITESLEETFRFKPETEFSPNVSFEYPLTVIGIPLKLSIGEPMTLTAIGDGFDGWYVNGNKVSDERVHTFTLPAPGDVISARTFDDYVIVNRASELTTMGFQNAMAIAQDGKAYRISSSLHPGLYTASIRENNGTKTLNFLMEGSQYFSAKWEFEGQLYLYNRPIPYSEVFACEYNYPFLPRFAQKSQAQIEAFCNDDSEYLKSLARTLMHYGHDMDRTRFARFVLAFVQSIPYVEDIDSRGLDEYWKFPMETLWDGGGDCEDKTFLYSTLMGLCGQGTAFLLFRDHTMPAIESMIQGYNVTIEGYRYVLCETTNPGFEIGHTTLDHLPSDILFMCRVESVTPLTTS